MNDCQFEATLLTPVLRQKFLQDELTDKEISFLVGLPSSCSNSVFWSNNRELEALVIHAIRVKTPRGQIVCLPSFLNGERACITEARMRLNTPTSGN